MKKEAHRFDERRNEETVVRPRLGGEAEQTRELPRLVEDGGDVVGETARQWRLERAALSDAAWVQRILREYDQDVAPPEGYVFQQTLQSELQTIPPEGQQARGEDAPPPPLLTQEGSVTVPKRVYARGLVWEVGKLVGEGAYGKVFEVRHSGDTQRQRLMKLMAIPQDSPNLMSQRKHFWNEIGALMASGDYVQDETIYDEEGNIWSAVIIERYDGKTLNELLRDPESREQREQPQWAYKMALAFRSILSTVRRLHALGWTHRDIKPGNILLNITDGEEILSRPIDFGIAQKQGPIRRKKTGLFMGSLNFSPPEVMLEEDVDMRLADYWSLTLTLGVSLGLFSFPREKFSPPEIYQQLADGLYIQAPDLKERDAAQQYFESRNITGAHRRFLEWIYRFIQPKMNMRSRQNFWISVGITQTLSVPSLDSEKLHLFPDEIPFHPHMGDFINDDAFVEELETHIRALSQQVGHESPDEILKALQEFPENQEMMDRIVPS